MLHANTSAHTSCTDCDHDSALLDILTGPNPKLIKAALPRRDAALDPLLLAAATSTTYVTRNHYAHDFFPGVMLPQAEGAWDWTKWRGDTSGPQQEKTKLTYVSKQGPRKSRLQNALGDEKENDVPRRTKGADASSHIQKTRPTPAIPTEPLATNSNLLSNFPSTHGSAAVQVKCMARTRIPTPHGPAFLHLYHNNRDNKEHLAIVIDPAQISEASTLSAPPIRSHSLDAVWSETETDVDRITRGAFVGRLTPTSHVASTPEASNRKVSPANSLLAPLIRIHSECFTGETIGSMRCDCGEQLDEAMRIISQPQQISSSTTIPGRGAVIYLRQEGRGIGLLSKIRAYNLQDLGHDTVTANLMLGHKADERGYEIAGAILRDLGMGSELGEGVRLLTNNPDKVQALENEGLRVIERVSMIPRSWQSRLEPAPVGKPQDLEDMTQQQKAKKNRIAGATMVGGGAVYGEDLDKYLRTKVLRMGHMLPLWIDPNEEANGVRQRTLDAVVEL